MILPAPGSAAGEGAGGASVGVEREIKFRLTERGGDAAVRAAIEGAGFMLTPSGAVAHDDRYLDTEDWLLYRAGLALRLRGDGTRSRLEAKTVHSSSAERLERTEWAQDAPPGDPPWPELPDGAVASLLRPLASRGIPERLRVRATIRNERALYRWTRGEALLGSVTVDRVTSGGRPPYDELEVELANGAGDALAEVRSAIADRLGLSPSVETKLAAALSASAERLPERDERLFAIHPADRWVDVAHKTLARHLGRLFWNEPGTRLGIDPEFLHDMRVASRRLRTALEILADAIPEERRERFARDLRWIGRGLGRVRDLDVAMQHTEAMIATASPLEHPALEIFARSLELRRARRRVRLLERLDSERYAAFSAEATAWIQAGPSPTHAVAAGGTPAYHGAPRRIAERAAEMRERFEEAERALTPEALHALRIAAKRTRYALEYLAGLEGPGALRRARRLARLQDFLGERLDAVALLRRMRRYARTIPKRDRELTLGAGSALGALERATRVHRSQLRSAWEETLEE